MKFITQLQLDRDVPNSFEDFLVFFPHFSLGQAHIYC